MIRLQQGWAGATPMAGLKRRRRTNDSGPVLAAVAGIVETQIVPRLVAAHEARSRGDATAAHPQIAAAPEARCIAEFAAELLAGDREAGMIRIERLRDGGMDARSLCLQVLAPAARQLGDLWTADRCSFLEVTAATALLHGIMNMLRQAFESRSQPQAGRRVAMLVTAPGEQHRFGLSMLAEFFRQDGWQVALPRATAIAQIAALAAARPFDIVGVSAGSDRHLGGLAACIAALRASSRNPGVVVIVGGPVFLVRPELVRMVGADGTAGNAEEAVRQARMLMDARCVSVTKRAARSFGRYQARTDVRSPACEQNMSHAQ